MTSMKGLGYCLLASIVNNYKGESFFQPKFRKDKANSNYFREDGERRRRLKRRDGGGWAV